ncbi:angiopoietin-2-like isoform X2 [Eublepharis macularius]|uniref:Angiopoietin-2-like isoform X2 n=1 Tax=Eublepharis macularius TaxID=481883 RepID=A0AA97KHQ0_EUBMA|nr:angiopoietin-2-like isoform X2 [Eublepharis macularius]
MGRRGDLACLLLAAWAAMDPAVLGLGSHVKGKEATERAQHRVQHGACTFTFLLPEVGHCSPPTAEYQVSNSLQRDTPSLTEAKWPAKRLQQLESILENNTQWLQKLESYLQENMRTEMSDAHLSAVQNHTVVMLEIGTSLLNQTAEQARKLTDVEMQVLSQTSQLEMQVLENSLSTKKLEKQMLLQTQEISRLQERNSFLEKRILAMEGKREEELQGLQSEKEEMQQLLSKQMDFIGDLEQRLGMALLNNTALQKQQTSLAETVKHLTGLGSQCNQISLVPPEEQKVFKDCAAAYKSGFTASGVYILQLPNTTITANAFCDMETSGGGWTVIQHRKDGSVDFQRNWQEYKMGFGSPHGEYWLGNEFVHLLTTTQGSYSLRIRLQDWESNEVYSLYDHFLLDSEKQNYRLYVRRYSGTAGRTSSLSLSGMDFSTKDVDNDNCLCKCAQMLSGGWWFDACGPSNLNGLYYLPNPTSNRMNGIKWHYWKGPSYSLKMAAMMIRPVDFREE